MIPDRISVPDPDAVHVWRLDRRTLLLGRDALTAVLAPDEIQRAERFHRPEDRQTWIGTRAVLRRLLGRYLGLAPSLVGLSYGAHGKPFIAAGSDQARLEFNVSHSGYVALYAFSSGRPIGVDVESVRGDWDLEPMMELALEPAQRAEVRASAEPALEFARHWVRREAALKAAGVGFGRGVRLPPAEERELTVTDIVAPEGYVAALAVRGAAMVQTFMVE